MSIECLQCGEDNDDSADKCTNCGCKFMKSESVKTAPKTSNTSLPVLIMTDLNSGKVIKINDNCTIGRKGNIETEFFAEDKYISEYHCRVIVENGEYKIEHLPTATNPTKINDNTLSKGVRNVIRNGDYLTIADKMFAISLSADYAPESADQERIEHENKYIITCPKCGCEYEVVDINSKINECTNCDDYDKYEISKIAARVKYAN